MIIYLTIALIVLIISAGLDYQMSKNCEDTVERYGLNVVQIHLAIAILWPFVLILLLLMFILEDH